MSLCQGSLGSRPCVWLYSEHALRRISRASRIAEVLHYCRRLECAQLYVGLQGICSLSRSDCTSMVLERLKLHAFVRSNAIHHASCGFSGFRGFHYTAGDLWCSVSLNHTPGGEPPRPCSPHLGLMFQVYHRTVFHELWSAWRLHVVYKWEISDAFTDLVPCVTMVPQWGTS